MSLDALVGLLDQYAILLDQYAFFAIGMLVVLAVGLLFWKKLRKIEVQLDNVCRGVDELKLIEARRFHAALNSDAIPWAKMKRAEPSNSSVVPEIADTHPETVVRG